MDRFYQENTKMNIVEDALTDRLDSVFDYINLKVPFKTNHAPWVMDLKQNKENKTKKWAGRPFHSIYCAWIVFIS